MPKTTGDYEIPFDSKGNQLSYGGYDTKRWVDNHEFEDVLAYAGFERGRSAAHMLMSRQNGRTVIVFLKDFEEMIPHMIKGKIHGRFTFTKRGQNYGCKLVTAIYYPGY